MKGAVGSSHANVMKLFMWLIHLQHSRTILQIEESFLVTTSNIALLIINECLLVDKRSGKLFCLFSIFNLN